MLSFLIADPSAINSINGFRPVIVRQSPIDIRVKETSFDPALEKNPLKIEYKEKVEDCCQLRNTGFTWQLRVGDRPQFGREKYKHKFFQ